MEFVPFFSFPFCRLLLSTPDPPLREVSMNYNKTAKSLDFKSTLDYVRIELDSASGNFKMNLDGEDREAIYSIGGQDLNKVATELGLQLETSFIDMLEQALKAKQNDQDVSAIIQNGTSEYFWMNTEQIDRFLIGRERPKPLADD